MTTIMTIYKSSSLRNMGLLVALLISASSCQKYFLDAEPQESVSDQFAIVDAATAESALYGVYDKVQNGNYYGGDGYQAAVYLSGGEQIWVGTLNYYSHFITHTYRADNTLLNNVWYDIFKVVNGANHIIEKVPQLDGKLITDVQKKTFTGEAYFLRALAFFDLGRAWGNIPLVLKPTTSPTDAKGIGQSNQQQVYNQVLADLTTAEQLLGDGLNRNRITKKTVYAFRARVHLYRNEWEKAEEYASKLITDPSYELIDWATFLKNKNTKESIFELAYSTNDKSSHFGSWSSDGYRNQFGPSRQLFNLLQSAETGGERKQLVKDISTPTIQNYLVQLLYWRPEGDNPSYLFRIAEQYLIRAEARANKPTPDLTGAASDLNAVRRRAALTNSAAVTKAELVQAIEDERRVEFALEPHRWFDLIRTNRAAAVLGVDDARKYIYPIPFNDLAADKDLKQNDGY